MRTGGEGSGRGIRCYEDGLSGSCKDPGNVIRKGVGYYGIVD